MPADFTEKERPEPESERDEGFSKARDA